MTEESLSPEVNEVGGVVLPGVGEQLKAAREAKELTVGDVAQMLKLGVRQVEAIERDQWSALPGATLCRGFVRNYARLVSVEPAGLMKQLDSALETPKVNLDLPEVADGSMPQPGAGRRRDYMMALMGLGLVVLALLVYFLMPNDLSELRDSLQSGIQVLTRKDEAPAAPEEKPSGEKSTAAEPAFPPGATTEQVLAPQAVPVSEAAPVNPAPAPETAAPAPSAPPAAAPAPSLATPAPTVATPVAAPASAPAAAAIAASTSMHFAFDKDSWIEVKDRNGKIVFSQLNAAGSQKDVEGLPPFTLHIGKAPGVHLIYKGKPVDLTPYIRGDVARLTLE